MLDHPHAEILRAPPDVSMPGERRAEPRRRPSLLRLLAVAAASIILTGIAFRLVVEGLRLALAE
jgi:hypothetical protein